MSWRIALRRVVVTGLGMVTPLGSGVDHNWSEITTGKSGISKIENFDVSIRDTKVLSALNGIAKLYETLIGIQEPKALLTCNDCIVNLN